MQQEQNNEMMIDVGETEGAEINLDQETKQEEEEKVEVQEQQEEVVEEKKEEPQEEPKKEEELAEYSEGVKKRIAKLTRKMREAERQKEEALTYAQSVLQKQQELESKYKSLDTNYVSEFENRVKSSLEAAKIKLKTAIDNQDVDGQITAQTEIAKLTMDAARLHQAKTQKPAETEEAKPAEPTPQQNIANPQQIKQAAQQMDPKAQAWAEKNSWFGSDSAMTYTAFDIHRKLTEEEGYDPNSDEYYTEVDKRIRLEFPNKFATTEDSPTDRQVSQTVASAKRPATTGRSKKTVKLTPSQVAIAKRLGVPLEEYAKQVIAKEA